MAELKQAVMDRIKELLSLKMAKHFTNDPVVDLGLAYINFALKIGHCIAPFLWKITSVLMKCANMR